MKPLLQFNIHCCWTFRIAWMKSSRIRNNYKRTTWKLSTRRTKMNFVSPLVRVPFETYLRQRFVSVLYGCATTGRSEWKKERNNRAFFAAALYIWIDNANHEWMDASIRFTFFYVSTAHTHFVRAKEGWIITLRRVASPLIIQVGCVGHDATR